MQFSTSSCPLFTFGITSRALPCTRHPSSVSMAPQKLSGFPAFAEAVNFLEFTPLHLFASLDFSVGSLDLGVSQHRMQKVFAENLSLC